MSIELLGVAVGLQEIKELIVVFKSIYDTTQLVNYEIPRLARLLIERSINLCDALMAAAQHKRDENLHPTIRAATRTLRNTLVQVNEVAIKANHAKFINRLLFAKDYHDTLKRAAETLTGVVTDLNLILRLDVSPDCISAEVQRAAQQDDAALLKSFQQMLDTYHADLYQKMNLQHQNVIEVLDAMHRRIKELQGVQPTDQMQTVMGKTYDYVAATISRHSILPRKPKQHQGQISELAVTSFDFFESNKLVIGSSGVVVRATWVATGTRVAIKQMHNLHGRFRNDEHARDIVALEAKLWCKLRHPHVLPLLGVSLTSDSPFFVMPLMENGNLAVYAKERPHHHLRLLHETAQGMAYLHSKSIVHGDLQASHVLVDHGGHAQVCDFGLAQVLPTAADRIGTYQPGKSRGNVRWIAPERYKHGPYQFEPDVFAFAMVMYEVVAGAIPFGSEQSQETVSLWIREGTRPAAPVDAPSHSPALWALVERCWDQDFWQRPKVPAVVAALNVLCTTQQIIAPNSIGENSRISISAHVTLQNLLGRAISKIWKVLFHLTEHLLVRPLCLGFRTVLPWAHHMPLWV
ncbi:TKL/TKL-CCIN protein kinase [Allomyces macrogynus ATCC 38327]|uniref:TKL/TKL-CCIN protein kinase n=1 Tax=Allomyces macrogynus (strain ATCC 38327) TaxID=578462 RepID=A0A0L0T0L2_ALLM3|nr:TKL/TKL-CCIN protein kinase [Allomyces macrogynus ATCC 38327]|eukprot:KNE68301.1 TKL/TKL-CCIN protein kinase [Allomyces macrogynus ATCC 38327]